MKDTLKTYVAENVLYDYTSGIIIVKAKNKREAIKKIKDNFTYSYEYYEDEIKENLRIYKDNDKPIILFGGG